MRIGNESSIGTNTTRNARKNHLRGRKYQQQRGIYIVLTVSIITTLVLLAILVIGLGYRSGDRVLLKNHANLIALAAMEGFVTAPSNPNYIQKADAGLDRANFLLNRNTLKGIADPTAGVANSGIGCLKHSDGSGTCPTNAVAGMIEYGKWYERKPIAGDPCNLGDPKRYPCFKRNLSPTGSPPRETANAVRVLLRNQDSNPITAPITGHLGHVDEHSFAIMVPRCMASIVDLSYSAVSETHKACSNPDDGCYCEKGEDDCPLGVTGPQFYPIAPSPPTAGLFIFPWSNIPHPPASVCSNLLPFADFPAFERLFASIYWCNMPAARDTVDPSVHFKSDYELEDRPAPLGQILVDKYRDPVSGHVGPQPFTRFMSAINAALRLVRATFTLGDKTVLMGFTGGIVAKVPGIKPDGTPDTRKLTDEIDYIIQLTNPDNIGNLTWAPGAGYTRTAPLYPNYLNAGFHPLFSQDEVKAATNLIGAIYAASEAVADNTECDEIARRSILLATDGLANCAAQSSPISGTTSYLCKSGDWSIYQSQEATILGEIRQRLIDQKISLTVLIDGTMVDPHFIDILDASTSPGNGTNYLTLEEARHAGYGIDPSKELFDDSPSCPLGVSPCTDQVAFENLGQAGYVFRKPLVALGRVALETGGLVCPLLRRCDNAAIDCPSCAGSGGCYQADPQGGSYEILRDCARSDGSRQYCSPINATKSEQAALCATKAVGGNPFALREPVTIVGP